jgi:fructokinase
MKVRDRDAYVARLSRIFRRADIVKASTEDLAYLFPDLSPDGAAAAVLNHGTSLVLVTDGPRPARGFLAGAEEISVPVPDVEVVDTIGAGDAFGGAFLAAWTQGGRGNTELRNPARDTAAAVRDALAFAAEAAARTCSRPGAEPPFRAEMTWKPGTPTIMRA